MILEPFLHGSQFAIGIENIGCKVPQKAFQVPSVKIDL